MDFEGLVSAIDDELQEEESEATTNAVGLDLGTFRSAIVTAHNQKKDVISMVGWPRDTFSRKLLKRDVIFGEEALEFRHAVNLYAPLVQGVIKEDTELSMSSLHALISYLFDSVGLEKKGELHLCVGVPARTSPMHQDMFRRVLEPYCQTLEMISEPVAVALSTEHFINSIVIDIGGGTVDICRMSGAMPKESDQITIARAGEHITDLLYQNMVREYPDSEINIHFVRKIKEDHSFVRDPEGHVEIQLVQKGQPFMADITSFLRSACESIVPDIIKGLKDLIMSFDGDLQEKLRNNIILAGGGSQIKNLDKYLCELLEDFGGANITKVKDPIYTNATGCLLYLQKYC